MELPAAVLRQCANDYGEICAFLCETFEKESFWAGYLAHARWRAEPGRPRVARGHPLLEIGRGLALPLAS